MSSNVCPWFCWGLPKCFPASVYITTLHRTWFQQQGLKIWASLWPSCEAPIRLACNDCWVAGRSCWWFKIGLEILVCLANLLDSFGRFLSYLRLVFCAFEALILCFSTTTTTTTTTLWAWDGSATKCWEVPWEHPPAVAGQGWGLMCTGTGWCSS